MSPEMPQSLPSLLFRYGVVSLAVAGAMLLRWPLWPLLGPNLPFLFLWPIVLLGTWYFGLDSGLLAVFLSALAAAYFLEARADSSLGIVIFVVTASLAALLAHVLARPRPREASQEQWLQVAL